MAKRSSTWLKLNKQIRAHCNANGVDDDTRKAVILSVTRNRTDSLGQCDDATMRAVLKRFQPNGGATFQKSNKPFVRLIWALWGDLKKRGALKAENTDEALLAFVNSEIKARQFDHIRQLDWLTYDEAAPVIEALKAWVNRAKKRGKQVSEIRGKTIEEVAEQVSGAVAKRLVEVFPGTRKYVPHKIDEDHELAVIGIHYARALVRVFAGSRLDIPMSMMSPKQRQFLILKLTKENMRVADIALRAGCTETRVYQVRREAKLNGFVATVADERQASLF